MRKRSIKIVLIGLFLALGTCKDSTSPPTPATVTVSAPVTTLEALGETVQVAARVLDKKGKVMSGVPVSWSSSNGSVIQISPTSGLATAVAQGSSTITAKVEGAQGSITLTVSQKPTSLEKVQGDEQEGTVGEALSQDPTVKLLDSGGSPVPGVSVSFSVSAGGGSISGGTAQTSSTGTAAVSWVLGTTAEIGQQLTASAGEFTAVFSATANPGPIATLEIVEGDGQSGEVLKALPSPLKVLATDQYENALSGVAIQWSPGSGSGSMEPGSGVTAADGTVQATWTLGPLIGTQQASATAGSGLSVSFSATGVTPPIASVTVMPPFPFLERGDAIQLTASAETVEGATLANAPFAWASSDPTVATVDQSGFVTGLQSGSATISATIGGVSGSVTVTVAAPGQQTGVRIETPATGSAGQTILTELILNTAGLPHSVGALEVTLEWDNSVLSLGDWSGFTGSYWWDAVRWTAGGRCKVIVSVPEGLSGEVSLLKIPFLITGTPGSASDLSLSVDRAISALAFQEIGDALPGTSGRIEVR